MLTIFILDSNANSRSSLSGILMNSGHAILGEVSSTPAGLTKAIRLKPQLICIDIGHADEAGFALLDQLHEQLPKALLLLISGNMHADLVHGASQRGVHGYIVKPFNATTVQKTIRNAVLSIARQQRTAHDKTLLHDSGSTTIG